MKNSYIFYSEFGFSFKIFVYSYNKFIRGGFLVEIYLLFLD